jgi:hypothetical protein
MSDRNSPDNSDDDSDNESTQNTTNIIVQTSQSSSVVAAVPLPELNETNDSYSKALIPYIVSSQKDIVSRLQVQGSISYLMEMFFADQKKSQDHSFIKNIWTLLCVIAGNQVTTFENKTNKFQYYCKINEKYVETKANLKLNSFFLQNFINFLPESKFPDELDRFIDKKFKGSRTAFNKDITSKDSRTSADLDVAFQGYVICNTFESAKAYINNTMNPCWVPKEKWIKKSGFTDQDALIETRIKLWLPYCVETAENAMKSKLCEDKKQNRISLQSDEEKLQYVKQKRNEKLNKMTLDWYPNEWFAFCLVGYGCTILKDYAVAGVLNTNTSYNYKTDASSGAYSSPAVESTVLSSPLKQLGQHLRTGREQKRRNSSTKLYSNSDNFDDTLSTLASVSESQKRAKTVEHVVVQDEGTKLKMGIEAVDQEIKDLHSMVQDYDEANEEGQQFWDNFLENDGGISAKRKRIIELKTAKLRMLKKYNDKNIMTLV